MYRWRLAATGGQGASVHITPVQVWQESRRVKRYGNDDVRTQILCETRYLAISWTDRITDRQFIPFTIHSLCLSVLRSTLPSRTYTTIFSSLCIYDVHTHNSQFHNYLSSSPRLLSRSSYIGVNNQEEVEYEEEKLVNNRSQFEKDRRIPFLRFVQCILPLNRQLPLLEISYRTTCAALPLPAADRAR